MHTDLDLRLVSLFTFREVFSVFKLHNWARCITNWSFYSDMKNCIFTISVLCYGAQSRMYKKSVGTGDIHSGGQTPSSADALNFLKSFTDEGSNSAFLTKRTVNNDDLLRMMMMKKRSNLNEASWDSASNWNLLKKRFMSGDTIMNTGQSSDSYGPKRDSASDLINSFLKNMIKSDQDLLKRTATMSAFRPSNAVDFQSH